MALKTLPNGLQATYNLNSNADDSSGNGNHGTVVNAILNTIDPKRGSGCYTFNGTNAYIELPLLNFDEIGISTWFRRASLDTSNADTVFGGWKSNPDVQLQEGFDVGRFVSSASTFIRSPLVTKTSGGVKTSLGETNIYDIGDTVGVWVHNIMTYNKTTGKHKVFVAGVLRGIFSHPAGNTIVPLASFADMHIGHSRVNTGYFHGDIDIVNVWNRPLTDGGVLVDETAGGEVAQMYNLGRGFELKNEIYVPTFKPRRR